jgi:hypothetical protein
MQERIEYLEDQNRKLHEIIAERDDELIDFQDSANH